MIRYLVIGLVACHASSSGDIDRSADPCTDFYDYATGAWRKAHPIPAGQPRWGRRAVTREANRKQVDAMLAELAAKTWPAGSTEQLAGDFYASCKASKSSIDELRPLFAQLDAAELPQAIAMLHALGIAAPFAVTGGFDNADPIQYLEQVGPGGADRSRIAKLMALAGLPSEGVIALEQRLSEVALDPTAGTDPVLTEHRMTADQLVALAPRIDWTGYHDVNVTEPKYIERVNRELGETPVATWKLDLKWRVLDAAAPWLIDPPSCAVLVEEALPEAVGKAYVERYFSPAAKAKAKAIAGSLVAAIEADIPTVDWMTPHTKQLALAKIAESRIEIGYPDHWQSYAGLVIRRDALWANVVAAKRFAVADDLRQVGKPTDRRSWKLPASSPLAYIDLQLNELVLPAGFLESPVFDLAASDAANYGAFGAGLAHDLLHAIDATGSIYAIDGKPTTWWTLEDRVEFGRRQSCVGEQYANNKQVLDEAVGDLGGLRIAYQALHPTSTRDAQAFFLAFGQLRGEAWTPETLAKPDIHPPPKPRVEGPLANLPEFQQAFSCHATPRCTVW